MMLLAFDIGNTNITLGCFDGDTLRFVSRMFSAAEKASDEIAVSLLNILHIHQTRTEDIDGAIISSVVPVLTQTVAQAVTTLTGKLPRIVGPEHHGCFKVDILPIEQIGADLIAASVAAVKKYPLPCLVADLGTATKILVIDESGRFCGCTIAPGVKISADALNKRTALLPAVNFTVPKHAIGTNTTECIQSGIVFGTAAMLDGMVQRILKELHVPRATLVATGGYSKSILPCCEQTFTYDENLLLDGLRAIYES